jgi:hypothetical protein
MSGFTLNKCSAYVSEKIDELLLNFALVAFHIRQLISRKDFLEVWGHSIDRNVEREQFFD